jgi:SAM-dependent methyltransferase
VGIDVDSVTGGRVAPVPPVSLDEDGRAIEHDAIREDASLPRRFDGWELEVRLATMTAACDDAAGYASRREGTEMSERPGVSADDPYGGRPPTSHERREGRPWDASYANGPAPWDVGRPQPAILRLAGEGAFAGAVLDAGCGTGENALHVAALGLQVLGVDVAETALSIARKRAAARGLDADFEVADGLHLDRLDRVFETVLDCGLFHTFESDERRDYVAGLGSVTRRGGRVYVLCFGDVGPETGPHPISRHELRAAFTRSGGWSVASVSPDRIQTRFDARGAPAWLATIERI